MDAAGELADVAPSAVDGVLATPEARDDGAVLGLVVGLDPHADGPRRIAAGGELLDALDGGVHLILAGDFEPVDRAAGGDLSGDAGHGVARAVLDRAELELHGLFRWEWLVQHEDRRGCVRGELDRRDARASDGI